MFGAPVLKIRNLSWCFRQGIVLYSFKVQKPSRNWSIPVPTFFIAMVFDLSVVCPLFSQVLVWCRCLNVGDDGLGFIAGGCKKIRKLNLCYCTKITDKGLMYLSQLEELSDLEMRSITEVTGTGLSALASGCRKLSQLDIKHCGNVRDTGFWSLAYYSWNLQQVQDIDFFCCFFKFATLSWD